MDHLVVRHDSTTVSDGYGKELAVFYDRELLELFLEFLKVADIQGVYVE